MKKRIQELFTEGRNVQAATLEQNLEVMVRAVQEIIKTFKAGGKVILLGNGGSAADCQHVAAEFIGRFQKERLSLPAISLTTDTSALTALANDYGFEKVFARQLAGLGRKGDVVLAFSTSGNSCNVLEAVRLAKKMGIKSIGLTGHHGGALAPLCDIAIIVPSKVTARIQEAHITIAHCLCELVEEQMSA
jgi:D-sedoheptulose 7-phosphate isomerase